MKRPGKPTSTTLISLGVVAAIAAALGLALGGPGIVLAVALAIVWLAWRFDNKSGTWLVLVVLFMIAATVPALLLVLMAVTH